jgi:hypothetical protein
LFDCDAYRDAHPDIVAKGVNPLVHYLESAGKNSKNQVRPEPNTEAVIQLEDARIIRLDLDDVQLTVFYANGVSRFSKKDLYGAALARAARLGIRGSVAIVSQASQGFTHWIAEPQQLPFLRAVAIDQVLAQITPVRSGQRLRAPSPQYQYSVKGAAE